MSGRAIAINHPVLARLWQLRSALDAPMVAARRNGRCWVSDGRVAVSFADAGADVPFQVAPSEPDLAAWGDRVLSESRSLEFLTAAIPSGLSLPTVESCDCRDCTGSGSQQCPHCEQDMECDGCDGAGEIITLVGLMNPHHTRGRSVDLGPVCVAELYLRLLSELGVPTVQVLHGGPITGSLTDQWMRAQTNTVDVLLMPIVKEHAIDVVEVSDYLAWCEQQKEAAAS